VKPLVRHWARNPRILRGRYGKGFFVGEQQDRSKPGVQTGQVLAKYGKHEKPKEKTRNESRPPKAGGAANPRSRKRAWRIKKGNR